VGGFNSTTGEVDTVNILAQVVEPSNANAMMPAIPFGSPNGNPYRVKLVASQATLRYGGSELERSGKVTVGLADPSFKTGSILTGARLAFGDFAQTPDIIRARLRRKSDIRSPDGSITLTWIPTGVPSYYQPVKNGADVRHLDTFNVGPIMAFMILGDQTTSVSATGHEWSLSVVSHFEIATSSIQNMVSFPTPSPYDPVALAVCLNAFQTMSSIMEDDGGSREVIADGSKSTVGSAWEVIENSAKTAYNLSGNPHLQQGVKHALNLFLKSNYVAGTRRDGMARLGN